MIGRIHPINTEFGKGIVRGDSVDRLKEIQETECNITIHGSNDLTDTVNYYNAIHVALSRGEDKVKPEVVEYLLTLDVDPLMVSWLNGYNPLHFAVDARSKLPIECIRAFLDNYKDTIVRRLGPNPREKVLRKDNFGDFDVNSAIVAIVQSNRFTLDTKIIRWAQRKTIYGPSAFKLAVDEDADDEVLIELLKRGANTLFPELKPVQRAGLNRKKYLIDKYSRFVQKTENV